jgi:hypothetical protein
LPAGILVDIIDMAGLSDELHNLNESDKELKNKIEALLSRFIPLKKENIGSASLSSGPGELSNIDPELGGRIESLLRRGRIPAVVENPHNTADDENPHITTNRDELRLFAFLITQPEDTGNINGGAAEEGSNNNDDGGNNDQEPQPVRSPSNGSSYRH